MPERLRGRAAEAYREPPITDTRFTRVQIPAPAPQPEDYKLYFTVQCNYGTLYLLVKNTLVDVSKSQEG